ncbi:LysR family transcriptional regulator [Legionella clemsonensis]|uniref:HTH-type transcriptional regulator GltC n=1 Tax=Legionella clemsonensis TaxID=1867846 RepID=A0A222P078_9GAMM|nr:LysR family transcriptional regulator [Legionella clemsonensis]ASQ45239.1 HTH-type transcriptional regulator GltC [Legionella clemsonensis]
MDINQIRAFIAAADFQSFTLAADYLYITQSAISKRIATLENEIKTPLFIREHNRLVLTEAGKIFLPHVIEAVQTIQSGISAVRQFLDKEKNPLKVGVDFLIGSFMLPDLLASFGKDHSNLNFSVSYLSPLMSFKALRNRDIEICLNCISSKIAHEFELIPLFTLPYVIKTSRAHPLLKEKNLNLRKILEHPGIVMPKYAPPRQLLEEYVFRKNLTIAVRHEAEPIYALLKLAKLGLGWCFLPKNIIDKELVTIYEHDALNVPYFIIYRKAHKLSPDAQRFITTLRETQFFDH